MSKNYAKGVPMGDNSIGMTGLVAPVPATRQYVSENGTASSVISVTSIATAIEISAVGGSAAMKWITTGDTQGSVVAAVSGANFDHIIPKDSFRRFVIPIEVNANTNNATGTLGANPANGLYQRVAIKTLGVASVLTSEY